MTKKLTFITGNAKKAEQLSKYLGVPVDHHQLDLTEIQSLDLEEVLEHKVKEAYSKLKSPVLVDDTEVTIKSFGKLPGPFIKWFQEGLGYPKIAKLAGGSPAFARVGIGLYDGREVKLFFGITQGKISGRPKGTNGFGWDVIFIPKGYSKTRAQLEGEDYDKTSPRKKALEKLEKYLNDN
jgi:non-canonical purine NTP pyrophosphatase (RdgB/HAM1 family)